MRGSWQEKGPFASEEEIVQTKKGLVQKNTLQSLRRGNWTLSKTHRKGQGKGSVARISGSSLKKNEEKKSGGGKKSSA